MPQLYGGPDYSASNTSGDSSGRALARVLMVDDAEADILLARRKLFDAKGLRCTFEFARAADEAMQRLISAHDAGRRFDLVLLDITLPGEDGYSLLRRIREHTSIRAVPVVMCTGSGSELHRSTAWLYGAIGYITKPPSIDKLKSILENLPTVDLNEDGPSGWLHTA